MLALHLMLWPEAPQFVTWYIPGPPVNGLVGRRLTRVVAFGDTAAAAAAPAADGGDAAAAATTAAAAAEDDEVCTCVDVSVPLFSFGFSS